MKRMKKEGRLCLAAAVLFLVGTVLAGAGGFRVNAEEPGAFWSFEASAGDVWVGENATLDSFVYDETQQAAALTTYNMGWAGRFGGAAIKGNVGLAVSAEKNRYLVISVKTDADSARNAYDNLSVIYYKNGDAATANWATTPKDAAAGIHGASSENFTKIILDLGWAEAFTLDTLRLDIMSSSLSVAASGTDGAGCGKLYINYLAFFDTREAAEAFLYPAPPAEENPGEQKPGESNPGTGDRGLLTACGLLASALTALAVLRKREERL